PRRRGGKPGGTRPQSSEATRARRTATGGRNGTAAGDDGTPIRGGRNEPDPAQRTPGPSAPSRRHGTRPSPAPHPASAPSAQPDDPGRRRRRGPPPPSTASSCWSDAPPG